MAWAKVEQLEPVNFTDIVSEEISKKIETKKNKKDLVEIANSESSDAQATPENFLEDLLKNASEKTCEDDALIAQMLQMQFDKENDNKDDAEAKNATDIAAKGMFDDSESEPDDPVTDEKDFNQFSMYSNQKYKDRTYKFDKKKNLAVAEACSEKFVQSVLHKLIACRLLKRVYGIISKTERAVIFCARLNRKSRDLKDVSDLPKECAVKVYLSSVFNLKQWDKYSKKDANFKAKPNKHISEISEREWTNYVKLVETNDRWSFFQVFSFFAKPIIMKHGALIMSLIGENRKPARPLNHAVMTKNEYRMAYHSALGAITSVHHYAKLVHTDISEHTLLWHNQSSYFVSISQCVDRDDENAQDYIDQAHNRLKTFFTSKGVSL